MNAHVVRTLRRLLLAGFVAGIAVLVGPGVIDASAQITDKGLTCHGSIDGTDVALVNSDDTSQAIQVPPHSSVDVAMRSDQPMSRYTVDLAFSLQGWRVAEGNTTGAAWADTVKVDDYARYGVGLYKVLAISNGPSGSCEAEALVQVGGAPIPGTVAGDVGAVLSGLGLLGLAGAGARAATGGTGTPTTGGSGSPPSSEADTAEPDPDAMWSGGGPPLGSSEVDPVGSISNAPWCYPLFVMALLMTVGVMATGGAPAGPPPRPRLPRARWRPRIAGGAIVSGIVGAIGVLVLLQQYGRVFPTGGVVARALVAGVAAGVLIPSLLRIIPVRRYNRRVAERERALRAA